MGHTNIVRHIKSSLRPLIVLFAKAPVPGRVKTRLGIDSRRAAELHSLFVRDTLSMLSELREEADIEISCDQPTEAWADVSIARSLQVPGDLGQRICHAIRSALDAARPCVMILGSDSPGLPPEHIRTLLACPADVAIGPTEDGGFYAISCRKAAPQMFHAVRWSTAHTLNDTVNALERCRLTFQLGPTWFDVDTPEDLARLGLRYS
jgi:rSAM/selenodomain-associated transferase 1